MAGFCALVGLILQIQTSWTTRALDAVQRITRRLALPLRGCQAVFYRERKNLWLGLEPPREWRTVKRPVNGKLMIDLVVGLGYSKHRADGAASAAGPRMSKSRPPNDWRLVNSRCREI